jgi:hypothetical protein
LSPLGQADISPFGKNLSQAATAAPAPCTKYRWPPLLPSPVITIAFFLFRHIRLLFFISPTLLFRDSGPVDVRHQSRHLIAPVIPLMMINFGNRYPLLTGLIRNFDGTVINKKISTDDSHFSLQVASLRQKLQLIAIIKTWSSVTFTFDPSAMISLYFGIDILGSWLFFL